MRQHACIVTRYRFRPAGDPGMRDWPAGEQRGVHMADRAAAGSGYPAEEMLHRVGQLG
jgi:hypothetical protein